MILPNTRAQFTYDDLRFIGNHARYDGSPDTIAIELTKDYQLLTEYVDKLSVFDAVNDQTHLDKISPSLYFYCITRHYLRSQEVHDANIADYLAAVLFAFSKRGRAWKIDDYDDAVYNYLVDLRFDGFCETQPQRIFRLYTHLGNFSLWQSGLYPEYVLDQGLSLTYFDDMGKTGFLEAAANPQATRWNLSELFENLVRNYLSVRAALNILGNECHFKTKRFV